jgi:hypothetical protein
MSTAPLEDKKVLRKLRKAFEKENKNAIARALHSQPLRKINTQGLQYLRKSLGLLSDFQNVDTLDAIFIAIDFEYSNFPAKTGRIRLREVGISRLDTRDIRYKEPEKIISSQHYRTVVDTKEFLFGTSIDIEQDKLVSLLKHLLVPEDNSSKQPRQLILVGHGFSFEIQVLRGLGINLAVAPVVENILDTHYLGIEVFGQDFSLSRLTRQLGLAGSHFHNAGNDANFSLRAMLLLATNNLPEAESSQQSRLEIYEKIARF